MFLSFIVPVYNTEKYLPECLDSLLDQDIPRDDYEIICINDGSTDGSLPILLSYANNYQNIHVIDQKNSGVGSARNSGLDAAQGDYIWFVDSDDMIHPNVLLELSSLLYSQSFDRLRIGAYTFCESFSPSEKVAIENHTLEVNSHYYDSNVWGSILKRSFCLKHNCRFFYSEISHGEDTLFMYELLSHLPTTFIYDKPFYLYRVRPDSAQTSLNLTTRMNCLYSYLRVAEIMQSHFAIASDEIRPIAANTLMSFLWNTLFCASKMPCRVRRDVLSRLKECGLYPYHRLAECTQTKSYQTTRTDFVGKLFDRLYLNLHRPWGFYCMCLLQRMISLKHRILK